MYCKCDEAIHLNNIQKHAEALDSIDRVLEVAKNELKDSSLIAYALRVKFPILLDMSKLYDDVSHFP